MSMARTPDFVRGRERGPIGVVQSMGEVLVNPRKFFRRRVAPGDQAPGLTFAMTVVFVEEASRYGLSAAAVPSIAGGTIPSLFIALAITVVLITPVVLHLVAAIQTLCLLPFVAERAGIGETVQVISYATTPCLLAGVPIPELRVVCTAYGTALLTIGITETHGTSDRLAFIVSAIPAAIVFGYGFRGFAAVMTLLAEWYII